MHLSCFFLFFCFFLNSLNQAPISIALAISLSLRQGYKLADLVGSRGNNNNNNNNKNNNNNSFIGISNYNGSSHTNYNKI